MLLDILSSCEKEPTIALTTFRYDFREWVRSVEDMDKTYHIHYGHDKYQFFTDTISFDNYELSDTIQDNVSWWDSSEYTLKFAWQSKVDEYVVVTSEVYLGEVNTIQRYYSGKLGTVFPPIDNSDVLLTSVELKRSMTTGASLATMEILNNNYLFVIKNL